MNARESIPEELYALPLLTFADFRRQLGQRVETGSERTLRRMYRAYVHRKRRYG